MDAMQRIHDELNGYDMFFLATINDGKPAVRPIGMHELYEGKEYFGIGTFKAVYRQLQDDPHLQIVACKGPQWIRISAEAEFTDDPKVVAYCLDQNPDLKNIYNEETGNQMGCFTLKNGHVELVPMVMGAQEEFDF